MVATDDVGDAARARLEILEAVVAALDRREEMIAIVGSAPDTSQARNRLMATFDLSEVQATAVLDLQVRRFTEEDRQRIADERDAIRADVGR